MGLRSSRIFLAGFLLLCTGMMCLWDYDTLRDEQRGLPTMSAILAGKWERHSDWFYEQRARQMRELLAEQPSDLAAIDNLAVALKNSGIWLRPSR